MEDICQYINPQTSSNVSSSSSWIDLLEDRICVIDFLKKFEDEIYNYTKHSHRARWQDLQLKHASENFPLGTILSIVDFIENYTFATQK